MTTYPPRITTSEVLQLARYGVKKLWKNRRAGLMPDPVDRGREDLFDRDAVLKALGMLQDAAPPAVDVDDDPWSVNPDAIRQAAARNVRHAPASQRRDVSGVLPGAAKATAPRLVVSNPASNRG